jgi:L-seryl-tRNA(Ser) seleniumtransferase
MFRQTTFNLNMRRRVLGIFVLTALIVAALIFRLGWIQFVRAEELQQKAWEQWNRSIPTRSPRGSIYDRNGYLLAGSATVETVVAVPPQIVDPLFTARALSPVLEMSVERIKSNQLTRALRVGKMTLAALESTLRLYLDEEIAFREIPILRMLTLPDTVLKARAEVLAARLAAKLSPDWVIGISREKARVGGGSLPLASLPSYQVTLERTGTNVNELVKKLWGARQPVISRVLKNKILLDLRSLLEEADELLIETIVQTFPWSAEEETGGGSGP